MNNYCILNCTLAQYNIHHLLLFKCMHTHKGVVCPYNLVLWSFVLNQSKSQSSYERTSIFIPWLTFQFRTILWMWTKNTLEFSKESIIVKIKGQALFFRGLRLECQDITECHSIARCSHFHIVNKNTYMTGIKNFDLSHDMIHIAMSLSLCIYTDDTCTTDVLEVQYSMVHN